MLLRPRGRSEDGERLWRQIVPIKNQMHEGRRGGECHLAIPLSSSGLKVFIQNCRGTIFPQIGKKYAYFSPNWLKIFKMAKKGWKFSPAARNPSFIWGKYINKKKGWGGLAKIWFSNLIYTPQQNWQDKQIKSVKISAWEARTEFSQILLDLETTEGMAKTARGVIKHPYMYNQT